MRVILPLPVVLLLLSLPFLAGCYNKPVRHLASDAALIEVGKSTRNDVLTYLGEPDGRRELPDGAEEWVYVEERPSDLQRLPVAGKFFDSEDREKVFIVLQDDIVRSSEFRQYIDDEFDWADDYDWQEKQE